MIEDGLSYPVRGDWIGRVIIGGVLGFLSVLVLPAIVLQGYFVDVLRASANGNDTPPEFSDWGQLLVDGVVGIVIALVYALIPMIVIGGIATVFIGGGSAVGGDGGGLFAGIGIVSILLLIPLVFIIYYSIPAALTAYATQGSIGAAFSVGNIKPVLLSGSYLIASLAPIIIAVILWIATTILSITVIGLVLVPFLQFYGQVAIFRMFGLAYGDVTSGRSTAV